MNSWKNTYTQSRLNRACSSENGTWATSRIITLESLSLIPRSQLCKRLLRNLISMFWIRGPSFSFGCHLCLPWLFAWILISVRKNGAGDFTLLVASAKPQPQANHTFKLVEGEARLTVEYGDFAKPLQKVVVALQEVNIAPIYISGAEIVPITGQEIHRKW